MRRDLTARQSECLRVIEQSIRTLGYPPTMREICNAMRIRSTNGVSQMVDAIERKGWLTRQPLLSRGITLVESAERAATELGEITRVCSRHGYPGGVELAAWLETALVRGRSA